MSSFHLGSSSVTAESLAAAARCALNVLWLLDKEVQALGCNASKVPAMLRAALDGLPGAGRKVIVSHNYPPIPVREFDYVAYYEGQEESGHYGYGASERAAILDLHAQEHAPSEAVAAALAELEELSSQCLPSPCENLAHDCAQNR